MIKGIAKKVLFHGSEFLGAGSLSAIPKNAAKGVLIPAATAAVIANVVTAPAAPAVPVLVDEVINEIYADIEKKIKAMEKRYDKKFFVVFDAIKLLLRKVKIDSDYRRFNP